MLDIYNWNIKGIIKLFGWYKYINNETLKWYKKGTKKIQIGYTKSKFTTYIINVIIIYKKVNK